jgi:hypothetical protein
MNAGTARRFLFVLINKENNMYKSELASVLFAQLEDRPKGGDRLLSLLESAERKDEIRLFIPWAAPPNGRTEVGESELGTIRWLIGKDGIASTIGQFVNNISVIVMPADSYMRRNNYFMPGAQRYWQNTVNTMRTCAPVTLLPSSVIGRQPIMAQYMAEEAYAFERLDTKTAGKVLASAQRYTNSNGLEAYQQAAQYCMARAAEARFVSEDLNALWISCNWQERDVMCSDAPRVYIPEPLRTPWLKETIQ